MAFRRWRGKTKFLHYTKGDTTVRIVDGGLVQWNSSGQLTKLNNDSDDRVIGVCRKTVATADTADSVPVEVPVENWVEWLIDTDSDGGAADSDVGRYCAIDTGDSDNVNATVDIDDSTVPHVLITGVRSSTQVIGVLARTAIGKPATHDLDS